MSAERDVLEQYWKEQFGEEKETSKIDDPFSQRCEVIAFLSRSNGRKRTPRQSRQVIFIINKASGEVINYSPEESRAKNLDDLAMNIYEDHITQNKDPFTEFRERVEQEVQRQLFPPSE